MGRGLTKRTTRSPRLEGLVGNELNEERPPPVSLPVDLTAGSSAEPSLPEASSSHTSASNAARTSNAARPPSFLQFLRGMLGWSPDEANACDPWDNRTEQRRAGIYNFFQVPLNLEPLLFFG
jgi:hypothetical protein